MLRSASNIFLEISDNSAKTARGQSLNALDRLEKILKFSGESHSTSIHTENDDRIKFL